MRVCSADEFGRILRKGQENVSFLNHHSYQLWYRSSGSYSGIDVVIFDGILMHLCYRFVMRGALKASFDNSSLAKTVFEFCSEERRSLYIIGSTAENATKFCSFVTDEYPQLPVLGCREGYFASGEERDLVIREIVDINPDVLVVGMGAAIQEEFLSDVRSAGWVGLGFTCGGFIHQTALRGKKFYPDLVVKLGLRWLFRLLFERGLVNRYTVGALRFLLVFSVSFQRLRRNKGYIL